MTITPPPTVPCGNDILPPDHAGSDQNQESGEAKTPSGKNQFLKGGITADLKQLISHLDAGKCTSPQ